METQDTKGAVEFVLVTAACTLLVGLIHAGLDHFFPKGAPEPVVVNVYYPGGVDEGEEEDGRDCAPGRAWSAKY